MQSVHSLHLIPRTLATLATVSVIHYEMTLPRGTLWHSYVASAPSPAACSKEKRKKSKRERVSRRRYSVRESFVATCMSRSYPARVGALDACSEKGASLPEVKPDRTVLVVSAGADPTTFRIGLGAWVGFLRRPSIAADTSHPSTPRSGRGKGAGGMEEPPGHFSGSSVFVLH